MFKVILADDRDISLRQIKRMKLWNGETDFYIAAEAHNGQDALDILRNEKMDLLITDIKMPKVDGIELLREVSENGLCSCVVLLSDYEDFIYAKQGIQYGAFDYLRKPAEYDDLKNLLERVKQLLLKKRHDSELVRSLEEKLEEKIDDHFPSAELEQLVEVFRLKSADAAIINTRFTDAVFSVFGSDLIKTGTALKRAMAELIQQLRLNYSWLDKFIDTSIYKGIDFTGMGGTGAAISAFCEAVEALFKEISALEYGSSIEQIENRICRHVLEMVDSEVSIEGISKLFYMNRKYLSEAFRQKTGELLIEYITRVKMKRAARILDQSGKKSYEISLLLGYKDTEYFSRTFKKYMGVSPSEYRNSADK